MKTKVIATIFAFVMFLGTFSIVSAADPVDVGGITCPDTVKAGKEFKYQLQYPSQFPSFDYLEDAGYYYLCFKCHKYYYEEELIDGVVEGQPMKVCPECKNDPGNTVYNGTTSTGERTYLARLSACGGSASHSWSGAFSVSKDYMETIPPYDPEFTGYMGSPAKIKVPGEYHYTACTYCFESANMTTYVIDPVTRQAVADRVINYTDRIKNVNYYHGTINVLGQVKFNANKGKVKTSYKWISQNAKVGKLPKPTRKGYKFKGWYTKKSGGKKITKTTKVKFTNSYKTYYAHWSK